VVTGQNSDYLLQAVVPDMTYYERFLLGRLTRIPGVTGVHSSFVLRRVLQRTALPLESAAPPSSEASLPARLQDGNCPQPMAWYSGRRRAR
jgi:hypothetical protein